MYIISRLFRFPFLGNEKMNHLSLTSPYPMAQTARSSMEAFSPVMQAQAEASGFAQDQFQSKAVAVKTGNFLPIPLMRLTAVSSLAALAYVMSPVNPAAAKTITGEASAEQATAIEPIIKPDLELGIQNKGGQVVSWHVICTKDGQEYYMERYATDQEQIQKAIERGYAEGYNTCFTRPAQTRETKDGRAGTAEWGWVTQGVGAAATVIWGIVQFIADPIPAY
jgi:hypothetical protein